MADSSEIDAALLMKLGSDAPLLALMPNGVHFGFAPKGSTSFVVVTVMSALDTGKFQGRAFESPVYLVKAVDKSTSGLNAKAAAARIDALLEDGTLTITGYVLLRMHRIERVRYPDPDQENDSFWQHRGGMYQVEAAPV